MDDAQAVEGPPHAKMVGGVWLPETEVHFVEGMTSGKRRREVEGRLTYQYHKYEAALGYLPAGRRRVAVDIGAHVGLWSMWIARDFDTVHAFEPAPPHAEIFPWNVDMEHVRLHRCALGRADGTVDITVPERQTGGAYVETGSGNPGTRYNDGGGYKVYRALPRRTLDSFRLPLIDFIKIDVEGYELAVLEGARQTLLHCRPLIMVEQKGNEAAYGEPRNAAVGYLQKLGMRDRKVIAGDHILTW